jgi:hypothetical protein
MSNEGNANTKNQARIKLTSKEQTKHETKIGKQRD